MRLASLTPAERLNETPLCLGRLVERARDYGLEACVDGQVAALLQGVPGKPYRMQVAVEPDDVIRWLTLTWIVRYPVDDDLMAIHLPRTEVAKEFCMQGGGLLNTAHGVLGLRVVHNLPATVRLCIQEASDVADRVEADVVRLDALPEHFQVPAS